MFLITSDYYIFYLHKVLKKNQRNIPYISPPYVEAQLTNFAKLESGMPEDQLHGRTRTVNIGVFLHSCAFAIRENARKIL